MSAISWGVGDILTLMKLAFEVYETYFVGAFEAPETFRQLITELASLKGVLRTIKDDAVCDATFPERLEDGKKQMLERCLTASYQTLKKLDEMVVRYRKVGDGEASFWKKIKWASEQSTVEDLKAKVMVHRCNLNLCMSTIATSSVIRLERSVNQALDRQQAAHENADSVYEMIGNGNGLGLQGSRKRFTDTDTTLVSEGAAFMSPGFARSMSDEDSSLTVSDDVHDNIREKERPPDLSTAAGELSTMNLGASNVAETVAAVMKEIFLSRQSGLASRPLEVEPQDPEHRPDDELRERFQALKDIELQIRRHNTRDWLRVATWWLLKARINLQSCERPRSFTTHQSISPSRYSGSPDSQAYVDLLKASWILYDVILEDHNLTLLLTDDNRKIIHDLSEGVSEYFKSFHTVDIPDKETLMAQNLKIWEPMLLGEEAFQGDDLLPGYENRRWITTELDDAGEEDEHVMYRTFVNAAIGGKGKRVRSRGALYMLLLSTKEGESEPKLTICNQSGTLSMTRDFTREDLHESTPVTSPVSGMELLDNVDAVPFNFGRLNVSVKFTHEDDMRKFMYILKAYFNGVQRREPRQLENATETLLFRSSVEEYEQLKASTMKPKNPRQKWQSCDLRILETTSREGWRTTRRLVVSSSASRRTPWCTEYFLPLSRVQISRVGMDRQVTMRWSDCSHEIPNRKDSSGYHPVYTYVYNDSHPNIALNLIFRKQKDATDFKKKILQLSLTPIYSFCTGSDPRHVYNISDTDPNPKQYKAILLTHTRHDWSHSDLFYMYQNTNYQYEHSARRVRLPDLYTTTYISTHVDKLYTPSPTSPPCFSHCEKIPAPVPTTIDFDSPLIGQTFLSSLTLAHRLIFSRCAPHVSTKPPSRFSSHRSSNKGAAEVQLWRKGHATRLVSRWHDHVEDKWLTIALPAGFHADGSGGLSTGGHSLSSSSSSSSSRDSNIAVLGLVSVESSPAKHEINQPEHSTATFSSPASLGTEAEVKRLQKRKVDKAASSQSIVAGTPVDPATRLATATKAFQFGRNRSATTYPLSLGGPATRPILVRPDVHAAIEMETSAPFGLSTDIKNALNAMETSDLSLTLPHGEEDKIEALSLEVNYERRSVRHTLHHAAYDEDNDADTENTLAESDETENIATVGSKSDISRSKAGETRDDEIIGSGHLILTAAKWGIGSPPHISSPEIAAEAGNSQLRLDKLDLTGMMKETKTKQGLPGFSGVQEIPFQPHRLGKPTHDWAAEQNEHSTDSSSDSDAVWDSDYDERFPTTAVTSATTVESLPRTQPTSREILYKMPLNWIKKARAPLDGALMFPNKPNYDSDGDSVLSVSDSVFSIATDSSQSSVEFLEAVDEFFGGVLTRDIRIRSLFPEAIRIMDAEKVERNFVRLLRLYARDLRSEARSAFEKVASQLVRRYATSLALRITQYFDQGKNCSVRVRDAEKHTAPSDMDFIDNLPEAEDSEDSGAEEVDQFARVRSFMVGGAPFLKLQDNFQDFVNTVSALSLPLPPRKARDWTTMGYVQGISGVHQLKEVFLLHEPSSILGFNINNEAVFFCTFSSVPVQISTPLVYFFNLFKDYAYGGDAAARFAESPYLNSSKEISLKVAHQFLTHDQTVDDLLNTKGASLSYLIYGKPGTLASPEIIASDPFYSLNVFFSNIAFSEMKFLNKMRWGSEKYLSDPRIYGNTSIMNLVSSKNILDLHVTMLQNNLRSIKNRDISDLTQDSGAGDWSQADAMTQSLQIDFEYLLLRAKDLSARYDHGLSTVLHSAMIERSRKAISTRWYSMLLHPSLQSGGARLSSLVDQWFLGYVTHPIIGIPCLTFLATNAISALLFYLWKSLLSKQTKPRCQALLASARLRNIGSSVANPISAIAERLGLRDSPLKNGKKRVRWTCRCGQRLYDDFFELRPGAAEEMEHSLNQAMRTRANRDVQRSGQPVSLGTRAMSGLKGFLGQYTSSATGNGLPQYNMQLQRRGPELANPNSQLEGRWLLVCAKIGRYATKLSHMDVCATTSDKDLFTELRMAYIDFKSRWSQLFTLRGIKSIRFVQFELHRKELVDIRKVPDMPSGERKKEYLYETCELLPPLGENYMMHLFHHPEDGDDESLTCLRVPKKRREKLKVCQQRGIGVGWGLHLVEGWLLNRVWILVLVLFVLGSLVFGICWSIVKHDIQGAFGVSAWMLALAMIVVGTVQAQLD